MSDIDNHFPIKKNGVPLYRKHQKEAIKKILDGFYGDQKFVGVEGPVGCGKSVINYTVGKCQGKKVTYLTSMKTLQDQISRERWVGVRSLKGKTGYLCNASMGKRIPCGYDGDDIKTCQNCTAVDLRSGKTDVLKFISAMSSTWEDENCSSRSSFINEDDFINSLSFTLMPAAIEAYKKKCEEDSSLVEYKPSMNMAIQSSVLESISCKLCYRECFHKSSRELARSADVRVLNPDVFFQYNRSERSPFQHSDLMVIDECHGFDGIMQRVFGEKLPIDILKTIYGIDLFGVYDNKSSVGSVDDLSAKLAMFENLIMDLKYMKKVGLILTIHNSKTYYNVKSDSAVYAEFVRCFNKIYGRTNVEGLSFWDILKTTKYDNELKRFDKFMEESFGLCYNGCLHDIILNIRSYIGKGMGGLVSTETAYKMKQWGIKNPDAGDKICDDYIVGMYLNKLLDTLLPFFEKFKFLSSIDKCFLFEKATEKVRTALSETPFKSEKVSYDKERLLEIVIVDTGKIANMFFYSKADKVLFSSGTWIYPETQKKKLGINSVELIRIPSTFDVKRRMIYVMDGMTNFSEKIGDAYLYKENPKVFVEQLESLVIKIKDLLIKNYRINPNIIVHCHTNFLAELIAANLNNVDNYWIHLRDRVWNKNVQKYVEPIEKEVILSSIDNNYDGGIVMVSPSLTEGVDFKFARARAQIILKHPMPNVEAAYIKNRRKGNLELGISPDKNFVSHVTYTTLTQQYGRVMRSEDDWGFTFIFDKKSACDIRDIMKSPRLISEMNASFFFEGICYSRSPAGQISFVTPF
jgi:hypothetical protein